jgi:hypothetical protein|tara:strand:- start:1183 stop:1413 length:231 start_codon:yes stop_codon:yes gene_type:complete
MRKENGGLRMILTIINETGHTELVGISHTAVIEQINDHPTHWVVIDSELTSREEISEVNWDSVDNVELIPAVVGGQ